MVYTAMHKYGDAIVIFDEVLKKKTESAEVYCRKADALRHLGRLDEAAYNYDVALQKKHWSHRGLLWKRNGIGRQRRS